MILINARRFSSMLVDWFFSLFVVVKKCSLDYQFKITGTLKQNINKEQNEETLTDKTGTSLVIFFEE